MDSRVSGNWTLKVKPEMRINWGLMGYQFSVWTDNCRLLGFSPLEATKYL